MLLLLCPRVKTLEIVAPPLVETSLIARLLDTTLYKDYQTKTPPEHVSNLEQEESDHAIARMFDAPWPISSLQKAAVLEDLVSCTIHGPGAPPSGLKFFKNLISLPSFRILEIGSLQGGYGNAIDDLEIGTPCPQLEKLCLYGCQLLTNESSSIVTCCPNLSTLKVTWAEDVVGSHNNSSDRDRCLRFGEIADAIAQHAPKLSSLLLSAFEWRYRHSSSVYPHTLGIALQQM
jgi:hypothetical protein